MDVATSHANQRARRDPYEGGYAIPRPTNIRRVVGLASIRGLPVGIARKGRIHVVRSVAEYDALVEAAAGGAS